MRKKIIGSYLLLIVLLAAIFSWIVRDALLDAMLIQFEHNLENEVELVKTMIENEDNEQVNFQEFSDAIKEKINVRVTIVDQTGLVLSDTDENPENMMNHINRDEIKSAFETGKTSVSLRYSDTVKADYLYAATVFEMDDSKYVVRISKPLLELKAFNYKMLNFALVAIMFASILASVMAVLMVRKITKPIYALTKAANDIADGDYGRKIYTQSKDQIGDLTASFNKMSLNLDASMKEVKKRNIELESILNSMINGIIAIDQNKNILMINKISFEILGLPDDFISENESMYKIIRNDEVAEMIEKSITMGESQVKELKYLNLDKVLRIYVNPIMTSSLEIIGSIVVIQDVTQIRKLEKMRSDFVSNVSHELKTPLTSIKGFVDTLKGGAIENQKTALRFLEIIDIESDRLYRLINDILLLSEIETMERESDPSEVYINEIIDEVIEMLSLKADDKNLMIKKRLNGDFYINANRDRIKQMYINLVDNAIKYTEAGEIAVSLDSEGSWIKTVVSDTGIGFDAKYKERLFERFYRVDKGRSRLSGGTGLGLSIVKHIVLLYKGKISVDSTPGKGTSFEILLPNKHS
ncbi:MAG: cell wall metabolism sensor histidine kinase WalK [Clostridiales bacterium]|nr:cell wall metabolism sensor histidine kinase WalK [Clostridiales bacterium]